MSIRDPQRDLPDGFRGGADAWDTLAGSIVGAEFFTAPIVWPDFVPAARRSVVTYTGHRSVVTYTGHRSVVKL